MTLRAVLDELDRMNGQLIDDFGRDELVAAVARAALLGARGNSGVILSQIVRGAAEELVSRPGELVDPVLVAAAFARAADAAYDSVRDPAEGTMLSAARAMAHRIAHDLAHMDTPRLNPGATPVRAGRADRGGARARAGGRPGGGGARARPAGGAARVRRGRRGRLRADGDRGRRRRRAARRRQRPARAPDRRARHAAPAPPRVERVPLLHQLRGHRPWAGGPALRAPARGDGRLGAGGRRRANAARARAHRRARDGGGAVRARRRGVAPGRGRHARAGGRPHASASATGPSPRPSRSAACWPSRAAWGWCACTRGWAPRSWTGARP